MTSKLTSFASLKPGCIPTPFPLQSTHFCLLVSHLSTNPVLRAGVVALVSSTIAEKFAQKMSNCQPIRPLNPNVSLSQFHLPSPPGHHLSQLFRSFLSISIVRHPYLKPFS